MGGVDQNGQRIIIHAIALHAGEQMAGGEQAAFVQGIAKGPHLYDNGFQPQIGGVGHDGADVGGEGRLGGEIHALPLQIADPHGAVQLLNRGGGDLRRQLRGGFARAGAPDIQTFGGGGLLGTAPEGQRTAQQQRGHQRKAHHAPDKIHRGRCPFCTHGVHPPLPQNTLV